VTASSTRVLQLPTGPVGLAEYGDPDGAPVLALHGAPASRLMFAIADEPARAAGLRIIAPDRPGYGLTPMDALPALASRTAGLESLADVLGLERFAVLAISGGAPYGVALASRLGARITALALVSPMGPVADFAASSEAARRAVPFVQRRFFRHLPYRRFFPPLAGLAARVFMVLPNGTSGLAPRLVGDPDAHILVKPHIRAAMLEMTREALRNGAAGGVADLRIYGAPWGVDFRRVCAPATLWQGTQDRVVPAAAALYLARHIPGCRLVSIEGAGHFWVFESLDGLCRAVRAMIDGKSPCWRSEMVAPAFDEIGKSNGGNTA
jgi:pimeloyl-ACP methyl ester carboxylesterase